MSVKNNMQTLVNKVEGTSGAPDMFCTRQIDG